MMQTSLRVTIFGIKKEPKIILRSDLEWQPRPNAEQSMNLDMLKTPQTGMDEPFDKSKW